MPSLMGEEPYHPVSPSLGELFGEKFFFVCVFFNRIHFILALIYPFILLANIYWVLHMPDTTLNTGRILTS